MPFDDRGPWDEAPLGLGVVLDGERGSLPYALIHGESLVACAAWALGEAGVAIIDPSVEWASIRATGEPVVLHDTLCPMAPPDFIASCVSRALEQDVVVVATRPVTDTVTVIADGRVGATLDRDGLVAILSPVVLPASVVATMERAPGSDLTQLVAALARTHTVVPVQAPAAARRVSSLEDLQVLEALTVG